MANKKSQTKKAKQTTSKTGQKGGGSGFDTIGSPSPVRKPKKKK